MKELNINIPVTMKQEDELTEQEKALLVEAKAATFRSYAPYSNFSVGAAALLEDGTIVSGSNQENSAYPSGICAERTTIFYANSKYPELKVMMLCVAYCSLWCMPSSSCGNGNSLQPKDANYAIRNRRHLFHWFCKGFATCVV